MKALFGARSFPQSLRVAALLCFLPLVLMLAGCGTTTVAAGGGTGGGGAVAPTVVLTATPGSIIAGASSALSVTASNATQVTVKGSDGSSYTLPAAGGSQTVTPTATTTYTATATGAAGTTAATASVIVTVTPAALATVLITASPTSITTGASSVLTVTATNATQVTVKGSDGSTYTLQPTGGTQTVTPTATTKYTASAIGAAGTAPVTSTATVTVTAAAVTTVGIVANPTSIVAGGSSVLTVTATNATQVTVAGSDGSSYTLQPSGGSQTVTPTATTIYTATATGAAGSKTATTTVTVTAPSAPTVSISANPTSMIVGSSSVLTVTATNSTQVVVTGSDGSSYTLAASGGTQSVTPTVTTTYTATATGASGTSPATGTQTVTVLPAGSLKSVQHVVFMLQENHTFDNYFGMLNPYRVANNDTLGADGKTYLVDGIDDKLTKFANQDDQMDAPFSLFPFKSTCIDDLTSSWLESYGDVSRYDFTPARPINMDGFVHTAEGFATYCSNTPGKCSGTFSDMTGKRSMGYYDQGFLNYYYYMASQFALSDRWFSPVSSKSVSNRIATYTGGTTQGLAFDPGNDDHVGQLPIATIFSELTANNVSWKIYYTVTNGGCLSGQDCSAMSPTKSPYPATDISYFSGAQNYVYPVPLTPATPRCNAGFTQSNMVGDSSNSFCINLTYLAPLSQYYTDVANGTLPQFAFIEAGYGRNDEHPGSTNSVLNGQAEVAQVVNSLMTSPSWSSSVFFMAYDEGGGPFDHVPPVPGSSNLNTDSMVGSAPVASIPDISTIAVDADGPTHPYKPCVAPGGVPTIHCDLHATTDPGANPADAAAITGFPAQLGFRVPNMIISPFTRKHYVGHTPMDHTAILKFVENRFINTSTHLTPRVAAQPDLLDFFDFTNTPWATPPTPPTPFQDNGASCTPTNF